MAPGQLIFKNKQDLNKPAKQINVSCCSCLCWGRAEQKYLLSSLWPGAHLDAQCYRLKGEVNNPHYVTIVEGVRRTGTWLNGDGYVPGLKKKTTNQKQ